MVTIYGTLVALRVSEDRRMMHRVKLKNTVVSCVVVGALAVKRASIVLPDTRHFCVHGRSVTRERWNQLTTSLISPGSHAVMKKTEFFQCRVTLPTLIGRRAGNNQRSSAERKIFPFLRTSKVFLPAAFSTGVS